MFALRLGGVPTSREAACLWECLEVPPGGCEGSPPRLTDNTRGGVCLTTATEARWWGGEEEEEAEAMGGLKHMYIYECLGLSAG